MGSFKRLLDNSTPQSLQDKTLPSLKKFNLLFRNTYRGRRVLREWVKSVLEAVGLTAAFIGLGVGIVVLVNQAHTRQIASAAIQFNYKVGSKVKCNLDWDQNIQSPGWVNCTIVSKTKDNRYYTASFNYNYEFYTYKFPIIAIGQA